MKKSDKRDELDLLTLVESTVAEPYTGAGSYTKGFLFGYGRARFSTSEPTSMKMQECDC